MKFSMYASVFSICLATVLSDSPRVARDRAYRSKWANPLVQEERDDLIDDLIVGDLIECKTRKSGIEMYHWQVVTYVLGGDVYIHHVSGESITDTSVKEELFHNIVRNYQKCRRNNGMDAFWTPTDVVQIVKCVDCLTGSWKYDLLEHNCEHFVNLCRYGKYESIQVNERSFASKLAARGYQIALGSSAVSIAASTQVSMMASAAYKSSASRSGNNRVPPESVDALIQAVQPAQATCLAALIGHS